MVLATEPRQVTRETGMRFRGLGRGPRHPAPVWVSPNDSIPAVPCLGNGNTALWRRTSSRRQLRTSSDRGHPLIEDSFTSFPLQIPTPTYTTSTPLHPFERTLQIKHKTPKNKHKKATRIQNELYARAPGFLMNQQYRRMAKNDSEPWPSLKKRGSTPS